MISIFPSTSHVILSFSVYTALITPLDCKYLEGGKSMSFLFLSPKCPSVEATNTPNMHVHSHTCMQTHIHRTCWTNWQINAKKYVILNQIHTAVIAVMIDHRKQCVKLACDSQRLLDKWGPGLEFLHKKLYSHKLARYLCQFCRGI